MHTGNWNIAYAEMEKRAEALRETILSLIIEGEADKGAMAMVLRDALIAAGDERIEEAAEEFYDKGQRDVATELRAMKWEK